MLTRNFDKLRCSGLEVFILYILPRILLFFILRLVVAVGIASGTLLLTLYSKGPEFNPSH
jgi:hypothetical protein